MARQISSIQSNGIKLFAILALLFVSPMVQGCSATGFAVGAGAAAGVTASKEGGVRNAARDASIRLEISDLWFKKDLKIFSRLNLTVQEGRVLITGIVDNPDHRVEAVRLAWQADYVEQVINEIQVQNEPRSWSQFARDNWITTQLRTKILFDKHVQSINYTLDTVQGVVYVMGIGQDQAEVDRVIDHARNIPYVTQVISYVRLRNDTPESLETPMDFKSNNSEQEHNFDEPTYN